MKEFDLVDFRQIILQASDAIFSTDSSFLITSWNNAAERLYGFTYAEVVGLRLGDVLRSSIIESDERNELTKLHEKGYYRGEYEFKNKQGTAIFVDASITVLRNSDSSILGYLAIHRNISDRKKKDDDLKSFTCSLEEQVKKKSEQLVAIFERITEAFVALDKNWRYTYVNSKAGEMFSRKASALIGKHIWTEFPEGIGQPFYYAYLKAMEEQHYVYLEEYYAPYDRWFENHIYPSPEGVSIFFKDTTEYKKSEEQARLSNQRLKLHLTNSPLGVVEWDTNLVITSWSSQAEAIFGWTEPEAVGKTIQALGHVHQDDYDQILAVINNLTEPSPTEFVHSNRNYTKSGKIIFCEWFSSVLKDSAGNIISYMSLVQDITEKRKAEEKLAFNEKQLDLIYNSSSDILYLISVEDNNRFKFITINKAFKKATGLTSEQILNRYVDDVIPTPSSQLVLSKYKEAIEARQTVSWEEITEYPSGVKTGLVSVTPVYDDRGNCIRLVGSVHDITENKQAETELLQKNEQLRNLSAYLQEIREDERANIAREIHDELGARLTGIRLEVSWMQDQISSSNPLIKGKFPALVQLIDGTIKTIRKISTDLRPSILDDFGLVDALEWQALEFEKRTGIQCQFKSFLKEPINDKKIGITLFRIFQESLTNVSRHAKATSVCAQLFNSEANIVLTITDNGVGMDLNVVQNKNTLGLIGMRERVLMVNRDYDILSQSGEGTTITVSVPIDNTNA